MKLKNPFKRKQPHHNAPLTNQASLSPSSSLGAASLGGNAGTPAAAIAAAATTNFTSTSPPQPSAKKKSKNPFSKMAAAAARKSDRAAVVQSDSGGSSPKGRASAANGSTSNNHKAKEIHKTQMRNGIKSAPKLLSHNNNSGKNQKQHSPNSQNKSGHDRPKTDWKVRPGYSSGASSFAGTDDDRSVVSDQDVLNDLSVRRSKHSQILGLETLRQQLVDEGDITKTVVRIETPFGKPIEEIYEGVQDGQVLGSGVSGIVRRVTHRTTGIMYAVKCLDIGLIESTEGLRQLRNEIFIMCQLDHPNIVRIEEVYESMNEIYIVQELCVGGDLFDRLDEQSDYHYTEAQCARLVKQMLSAVRYLHSKGIIHRDLKLENFLFSSSDPNSELKMIDFGLSKHFGVGENLHDKVGTPYTVAPEIIKGTYNEKSDIWSLGVITYLLLSGETPFGGLDGENLLLVKENIMRAKVRFDPADLWEHVSSEGKAFVKRLLGPDPARRPTAREAQKDRWIQVWAKKDVESGNRLDSRTITALMSFKEQSDMQKLLSEVLSFTLLPEQIVDLRKEFEKIDTDGVGEISLAAMKQVFMENAEAGALGSLTEEEVEALFDSIRVRKSEPTIRWHEFLAAGLSRARVDDRNLRLAFDRLDTERKGFITFDDLQDLLGSSTEAEALEKIWLDSLKECKAHLNSISFDNFKRLMKGQPKEPQTSPMGPGGFRNSALDKSSGLLFRSGLPFGESKDLGTLREGEPFLSGELLLSEEDSTDEVNLRMLYSKKRSRSVEQEAASWDEAQEASLEFQVDDQHVKHRSSMSDAISARSMNFSSRSDDDDGSNPIISPLVLNRALYRKHREMRIAVLEASKQFDRKRNERNDGPVQAGLIMKRGAKPPVELEDEHTRALFAAAAKRCGRSRRTRNKTVSDVTGMINRNSSN